MDRHIGQKDLDQDTGYTKQIRSGEEAIPFNFHFWAMQLVQSGHGPDQIL